MACVKYDKELVDTLDASSRATVPRCTLRGQQKASEAAVAIVCKEMGCEDDDEAQWSAILSFGSHMGSPYI